MTRRQLTLLLLTGALSVTTLALSIVLELLRQSWLLIAAGWSLTVLGSMIVGYQLASWRAQDSESSTPS